jgi:hypothetical protein
VKQEETESWPRIYWGPSGHPQYASIQAKNVPHSADSVQHPLKFPLLLRAKLHQTDFVQDPKWSLKRPLQITAERLADPGARAHACNLSYSGGRDQEHCSLKPAWANSLWDPISKNPITKKGWWSGSRCRPWVQTPVPQKNLKNKKTHTVRNREVFN